MDWRRKNKIRVGQARNGSGTRLKTNNSKAVQARDGRRSGRMTLFVEWAFSSEKKNDIKADQARDGRRAGRMTLFDGWAFLSGKKNHI